VRNASGWLLRKGRGSLIERIGWSTGDATWIGGPGDVEIVPESPPVVGFYTASLCVVVLIGSKFRGG
jgi:hypothetical protein